MKRIPLTLILGLVLALLLVGCGGDVIDAGPVGAPDDADVPEETEEPPADVTDPDPEPTPTTEPAEEPAPAPTAEPTPEPKPQPKPEPTTAATTKIRLYFMAPGGGTAGRADPFLVSVQREIPATQRIALASLRELVAGPSAADKAAIAGISTAVPADTLVLGVTITDRVATVDLSREFESGGGSLSMFSRLAQVVYTVTQFPTVDEVAFSLDGRPVTVFSGEGIELDGPASRADLVDLLPTVFVDTPAAGARVTSPLRATGLAAVFEATFQYRLETADGRVLAEGHTMSDNGMGWGAFDLTISFDVDTAQAGRLIVWEYSAKDGSVQARRVTPLTLLP
jgi:germination protein M